MLEINKRVVLVTNTPAPYRLPALTLLAKYPHISLTVIYCAHSLIDKTLDATAHGFEEYYLKKPYYAFDRRFMHSDAGVIKLLQKLRPDVVITTGYIPTFLFAFIWSWWRGIPHIAMTDGTLKSEQSYSYLHGLVRRFVFKHSASFIGACEGSLDLFQSYGLTKENLFKAPLAIHNQRFFKQASSANEKVDFLFCGRIIKHKGPIFALEVAVEVSKQLGRIVSIDFVGAGDQEDNLLQLSKEFKEYVQLRFHGYATQEALPAYYNGAKIFLFPSEWDPWGVVANEACAAGLPVIVSPYAGVAGEMVIDGENGFVRALDLQQWARAAVDLLSNPALLARMGARSRELVQNFSFETAAMDMNAAIVKAAEKNKTNKIDAKQIVIVSLMRPTGTTGVQTHVNTLTAYLDSIAQPWQLVTPFSAPKLLLFPLLALRRLIGPISPAAAVWLYRKGHSWLLGLALGRILKPKPNIAIYAQCPVSANVALEKRSSASQQVTLVVHFNISQAEEWADKKMIVPQGKIYQVITDFENRVILQVDNLVFVSAYMQQKIWERLPMSVHINQKVIPNFVVNPNSLVNPQLQILAEIDADLIAIGTLEPRKNQTYLLDIIAAANALGEKLTLTLAGDGPDKAMLEHKAKYLSIDGQVHFKGFVSNGSALIARHKACIHVAKIENLPLTLIEALAYAKPILAAAVGGVPELFDDNVHGRTLPLDDANEAAKIVVATLKDKALLAKFGDAARRHYLSNFEQKLLGNRLSEFILNPIKADKSVTLLELKPQKKRTVVIVQRCITVYRVPLFEQLKRLLEQEGIQLRLLYGDATVGEQTKRDTVDIAWGEKLATRYFWGNRICWQPFSSKVRDADLVIVTQENKLVSNIWPLFGWRKYKLAFWGHGKNMQVLPTIIGESKEQVKFLTTNRVDWWFVYTNVSLKHVNKLGFSTEKMTNLENSIDTSTLKALCEAVTSAEIATIKSALDLGNGPIGLYVGSLYKDKRLEFLLSAGKLLSQKIPNFRLIVIGDGPQSALINNAQAKYHWLRFVGRQEGAQKARYLKMANVLLNPGLLGLSILDGFAAGIPIVTTDCGLHSPEIDYLHQGVNGFMTANTVDDYVQTVERILTDVALAKRLQSECLEAAKHYTLENMAENFRAGILKALS